MSFFSSYLLHSLHPSVKPRTKTYVGFTVNPPRRLRQHNGEIEGGARRTHLKRPWEMVCLVYGFPTKTAALQFEAAWTYPKHSRFLRECRDAKGQSFTNSTSLKSRLLVLHALLSARPWRTYSLSLHFFKEDFWALAEAYDCTPLPSHIPLVLGDMELLKTKVGALPEEIDEAEQDDVGSDNEGLVGKENWSENDCMICLEELNGPRLTCTTCSAHVHVVCLAEWFTGKEKANKGLTPLLPTKGTCPGCRKPLVWGTMVRRMHNVGVVENVEVDTDDVPLAKRLGKMSLGTPANNGV